MFKHFPKTMKVLLGLAVIMIAIMYGYVWFNLDTGSEQAEEARQPADPETVTDHMLELSGTNYEEVTDEEGNTTGTFASTYVKYRAPDGTYQPIDTAITVSASEDYEYENITNVFQTQFSGQTGGDDKISFSVAGGRSLTFAFIGPQASAASVDGSTISYPEVYDGLDAKYTVTNDKLIEELILNKEIVLDKVSQQIELNNVYFKQHNDGSVTFHDSRSGNIVFSMHQPYMYEKNNPEKSSYGVEYEFVANEAGYILNKKITETGKDWLATAEYPVVIDPGLDISFPYSRVIVEPTTNQQLEVTFEDSSTGEDGWF
ncbi:hypothetical protein KKC06_06760, partial [Patescibacteria group bacterium]|nr:hypothetical protein [Patescibacteria group bacterium]